MEPVSSGGAECAQCGVRHQKDNFSKKQWGLKADLRKCKTCVGAAPESEKVAPSTEVVKSENVSLLPQELLGQADSGMPNGGYGTGEKIAPASVPDGAADCAECGVRQPRDSFSKKQWSLKVDRKCKICVGAPDLEKVGKAPTKVDLANLVCEQLSYSQYFQSAERTEAWWAQHQEGFRGEQEWMVARGQESSFLGMASTAEGMANIVFNTTSPGFKKVSFCARNAADEAALAFAFVDVDPDQEQPCHLRMLLVAPKYQRQGVGSALLKMVVGHFGKLKRHLGLKFARVSEEQEKFFAKAGLQRIGMDEQFIYMARKVIIRGGHNRR